MRIPRNIFGYFILFILCLGSLETQGNVVASGGRVLYLGDSLSMGAFGRVFDSEMRSDGLHVITVVAGGASPYYWLRSFQPLPCTIGFWQKTPQSERRLGYVKAVPKIEDLMDRHKPNVVVVQTGINLYATLRSKRRPKDQNVAEVYKLIDGMCKAIAERDAKSYWILPPHSHERRYPASLQSELAGIMKTVVREYNGAVFESQKFTRFTDPYPATDGIHYGPGEARTWAQRVAADFEVYMRINHSYAGRIPDESERALPLVAKPVGSANSVGSRSGTGGSSPDPNVKFDPAALIQQAPEVDLTLKLVAKSKIENLNEVPYKNALGVFEYEVVRDKRGNYPLKKIRIAHGIVFNRKETYSTRRQIGDTTNLKLVPLAKYPNLQRWQTVDQLRPNFDLPLYTPKLD